MSFDLMAWKAPRTTDEDEAKRIADRYYGSGDPDVFEPSADVLRFYDELIQRYPELGAYREASDRSEALWTVSPERSDRVIELCIKWGAPDEALDFIVDLARKYDLVLYDPQGPSVHWPEPPPEPQSPRDRVGEMRRAAAVALVGALLVVAGWFVPYRILGWPLMGIGLFVLGVIVFTSVAVWRTEGGPS